MRKTLVIVWGLTACILPPPEGEAVENAPPPAAPLPEPERPPLPEAFVGVMDAPRHGTVVAASTQTARVRFHGYAAQTHQRRRGRLGTPCHFTGFDHATVLADRSTVYEWQTEVVPATAGSQAWPQGGLARVRAQIANTQLPVYAADADACLASAATVQAQIEKCAYRVVDGAVLVSSGTTSETAAQNPLRPLYLARKGVGSEPETELYYTATNASPTLAAFRTRFGFTGTAPTEAQAAYLNRGDLEVGRDMHCNTFAVGNEQGLACYSSNYGAFSGDPTTNLDLAVAGFRAGNGAGAFATVTMVYTPPIDAPNAVAFAVYNAAGNRVNSAQLDRFGDSVGIPHNCLNCHGSASTYDTTTHAASNARFLMFDPEAFAFSRTPGFTFADQAEQFRRLNNMVLNAGVATGVREYIDGLYAGNAAVPNAPAHPEFVPPA